MANLSVRRAVKRSWESVGKPPLEEDRLREIDSVEKPVKKAGLLGIHMTVRKIALRNNPSLILLSDISAQSVVYLEGDTVLKVVKEKDQNQNPTTLTRRERRNAAAELREQHGIMVNYLGQTVVPHSIKVETHPIFRFVEAIVIRQPFCQVDFMDLDPGDDSADKLTTNLITTKRTHPHAVEDLSHLLSSSRQMAAEANLYTDIVGANNIGFTESGDQLAVIDSQPVPPNRPADQLLVRSRFDLLAQAIARTV